MYSVYTLLTFTAYVVAVVISIAIFAAIYFKDKK